MVGEKFPFHQLPDTRANRLLDIRSAVPQYSRYALVIKAGGIKMRLSCLWNDESGQDIAEYAVMLAVILVLVVGTVRLIGSNANNAFSNVASSIQ